MKDCPDLYGLTFVTDGTVVELDFEAVLLVFANERSGVTFAAAGEDMDVGLAAGGLIFVGARLAVTGDG